MREDRIIRDGHMHSQYCPHGSNDILEQYIERALERGLEEISFTEHMPLPLGFEDPSPDNDSSMNLDDMKKYFQEVKGLKEKYKDKIKINLGLEVDYLEGYEEEIRSFLNNHGHVLEDGLLSVHMIKVDNKYCLIDFNTDEFERIVNLLGGVSKLYDKYYETLLKAIKSDLGKNKPKRIGHPTLVRKFNKRIPLEYNNIDLLEEVVREIKTRGYEIDCNTSGLRKADCGEIYPSGYFMDLIKKYEIPIVYGSDAHIAKDVAFGFDTYSY